MLEREEEMLEREEEILDRERVNLKRTFNLFFSLRSKNLLKK